MLTDSVRGADRSELFLLMTARGKWSEHWILILDLLLFGSIKKIHVMNSIPSSLIFMYSPALVPNNK